MLLSRQSLTVVSSPSLSLVFSLFSHRSFSKLFSFKILIRAEEEGHFKHLEKPATKGYFGLAHKSKSKSKSKSESESKKHQEGYFGSFVFFLRPLGRRVFSSLKSLETLLL